MHSGRDERIHLAYELGHCMAGTFYDENADSIRRSQCEARADRWAVQAIIDKNEFIKQLKNEMPFWELAEYFDVTVDFIKKAYHSYVELQPIK